MPNSPLQDWEANLGAKFVDNQGWLLPSRYGDVGPEYDAATKSAALFDTSHHGKVSLSGRDTATFLHNLCTNDIVKLAAGEGKEAFLTTGQAKIVAYVTIYRSSSGGDMYSLDAGPGMNQKVLQHLDRYLISEQVELQDRTSELVQLHLAGPKAALIMDAVTGQKISALGPLCCIETTLLAVVAEVRRHDRLGLTGFDILCPASAAVSVAVSIRAAGATPAGVEAHEILRIEAGTPVYGIDIDETNLPQEVDRIEATVSFTKGCYIGQETVARIRTYGHVNRSLVGLQLTGREALLSHAKLFHQGKEVGAVTSSVVSRRLDAVIALAYLRRGSQEPGTRVEVEAGGARQPAEVTSLPFTGASA